MSYENALIIVNLFVWESVEALRGYVYKSQHTAFLRRKKEWFDKLESVHFVMWWILAGHIPTIIEAKAKLEHLATHGDTAAAFTFRKIFPAVEAIATQ